jgi:D-glycero-D-manno-heptose 1,7-bisphosphate phosphatase
MNKALFLDRDGIINKDLGYVHNVDDFIFNPDIFNIIKYFKDKNFKIIVVTNQSGIGRGLFTIEEFNFLNNWMLKQFANQKAAIDKVYFCASHPFHGVGEYKKDDYDRKPNPGMIFRAKDDFNIDLANSIFIGDRETDLEAAISAEIGMIIHCNKKFMLDINYYKKYNIKYIKELNFQTLLDLI